MNRVVTVGVGLLLLSVGTTCGRASTVAALHSVQSGGMTGAGTINDFPATDLPLITSNLMVAAVTGRTFSYQIEATNSPTSYQASNLPDGLSFDTSNGTITGVPSAAGLHHITIGATNAIGTRTATLTLTVADLPVVTSATTATGYVGYPFYYRITATGDATTFAAPGLPNGLNFDPATGIISGRPVVEGVMSIPITAGNAAATGTGHLSLNLVSDGTITILHALGDPAMEGANISALIRGSDGNLYGTTTDGGAHGGGTFFRCTPGGAFTTLHHFAPPAGYRPITLNRAPDGSFYGTTINGGAGNLGTVFKVTADGVETTLGDLHDQESYSSVTSVLLAGDGNYYGTLSYPGAVGNETFAGSVFKLTPGGKLTTLHQFSGRDGASPNALIQARDGNFYGTAEDGIFDVQSGEFFRLTPDGAYTTLHVFTGSEGSHPTAALFQADDGNFYGTAIQGGKLQDASASTGGGTVFEATPGGTCTAVHAFGRDEGTTPASPVVQGIDGAFYGTTNTFSSLGFIAGTIYRVTPDGVLSTLHVFVGSEGMAPFTTLIPNQDGTFYGGTVSAIYQEIPGTSRVPVVPTVFLAATVPRVTVGSGGVGVFTVSLSAPLSVPLTVYYTVKGSAVNGTDYVLLNGKRKIKPGKTSKPINVAPLGDLDGEARKAVKIVLQADPNYIVGTPLPAKVKIFGK